MKQGSPCGPTRVGSAIWARDQAVCARSVPVAATYRVLVTDKLASEGLEVLKADPRFEVVVDSKLAGDPQALRTALGEADGVVIRSGTMLTPEVLRGQTRLKAIVRAGVGVDNIDVTTATRQGIVVMNTPGGNTLSTAEHTLALLLALSRNIAPACASLKAGRWDRSKYTGSQLAGKTLGIIGLGRVGQAVAQRAIGFGMKVLGHDPFLSPDRARELGIEPTPLAEMWCRCDYLTLHVPLTEETRHLIGPAQFAAMKPGVRIVNCARGGLIDEPALIAALDAGKVAGAAIDVFEPEPPPADDPLVRHPKVLVTPHLGASTEEAQISVAVEAARLLIDFLGEGRVRFAVNMPNLDKAELDELRHHLELGRRLGMLHAQMDRGAARSVKLDYRGDIASRNTRLISAAFTAGWMETALTESVNLVNALVLAQERGIQITESHSRDTEDFGSLISAEVVTDRKTYHASAALFGRQRMRLVGLGPYQIDCDLEGVMLIFTHLDRPGLIGSIGTLMGNHNVNIAQMNVGRAVKGGEAIGVVNLDSIPPEEALEALRALPDLYSVTVIQLPERGELPAWLL